MGQLLFLDGNTRGSPGLDLDLQLNFWTGEMYLRRISSAGVRPRLCLLYRGLGAKLDQLGCPRKVAPIPIQAKNKTLTTKRRATSSLANVVPSRQSWTLAHFASRNHTFDTRM
jgi:hypothetical protein